MSGYEPPLVGRAIAVSLLLCMAAFLCVGFVWGMYAGVAYRPPVADNGLKIIAVVFTLIWLISAALVIRFQRKS